MAILKARLSTAVSRSSSALSESRARAWFRSSRFWVTRTRGNSRPARAGFGYESYLVPKAGNLSRSGLLGLKRSQAQHRQPMRMPLAGHHFARAFALALRTSTAQEAAMVQKELK